MKHFDNNLTALDVLAWLGSALGTAVIAMLAAVLMAGCSPRTIPYPVETVRYERVEADTAKFMALINSLKETVKQKESRIESLIHKETEKETTTLNDNGDTIGHKLERNVYIHLSEKERTEYEGIIRACRDSIGMLTQQLAVTKVDSIPVPYPVERELSRWGRTKMELGGWAFGGLIVAVIAVVWLVFKKRRR